MPTPKALLHALLERPDSVMLELGAGGELVVARMRLALSSILLLIPLISMLGGDPRHESLIGLVGAVLAIAMAAVWWWLARVQRHAWLPFATVSYDITLTTLVLALLARGSPPSGLNSMVVWVFYLFGIVMTALRNDGRLTVYAGALAIAQYLMLALWVFARIEHPAELTSPIYGTVAGSTVGQRLVVLALMTLVTATVVYRMQRLVSLSGTDGLTRLPNRSWLMHRLPLLLRTAQARGQPYSVCIIDLDHFKRINDDLGHQAGDLALQQVTGVVRERLQGDECLARLGGEEFALLLPVDTEAAMARVDALRAQVASTPFRPASTPGNPSVGLSFSAGIATAPADASDLSTLLRIADARLRAAKHAGRNRVFAHDLTEAAPARA